MKRLFYLTMVFVFAGSFLISCGGGGSASLEGTWQLSSVSGEELTDSEKSATIAFTADGKVTQKRGERERVGTWELKEEGGEKHLTLTFDGDADKYKVVELSGSTFAFMDGDDKVTFKKK